MKWTYVLYLPMPGSVILLNLPFTVTTDSFQYKWSLLKTWLLLQNLFTQKKNNNNNNNNNNLSPRELDAFIAMSPYVDVAASKFPGCPFIFVGEPLHEGVTAIAFSIGSPWKRPISNLIDIYRRKEYFRLLRNKWFRSDCSKTTNLKKANKFGIQEFGGLFLVCFAVSPVVCLLLLIIEILWYLKVRRKKRTYVMRQERSNQI